MPKLDADIARLEDVDLTGADIERISGYGVNVYTYEQLPSFDSIDELLGSKKATVILYQTEKQYGHWVLLFENTSGDTPHIEFFDSLGWEPDSELKLSEYNIKQHRGEIVPYLSYLISRSALKVKYNNYPLQKFARHVNTCGRWCAIRALWRHVPLNEFVAMFSNNKEYPPDFWVSALTFLL